MMKAARRKLKKLWSRKKKKKNKSHNHHHQAPPEYHLPPTPNYHYRYTSCSSSVQIQPSAPPLPTSCLDAPPQPGPDGGIIEYSYSFLRQFETHQQGAEAEDEQEEITVENYYTTSPVAAAYSDESRSQHQGITTYYDNEDALLYQKYLVPDPPRPPVYGVPTVPAPPPLMMEKTQTISGMLLACVVKLGAYLFPCFCPCFHIREARRR